jgi:hypothetical protein
MTMVWLVLPGCVVAGSRGGPGVRGVRDGWSCSYSGAGPRPLFVARPLSKDERARPRTGAQATDRGVCASREARAASPAGDGLRGSQRELVSLFRVMGVGAGAGVVIG